MNTKFLIFLLCSASFHFLSLQFLPWGQGVRTQVSTEYVRPIKVLQMSIVSTAHEVPLSRQTIFIPDDPVPLSKQPLSHHQVALIVPKHLSTLPTIRKKTEIEPEKKQAVSTQSLPLILKEGGTTLSPHQTPPEQARPPIHESPPAPSSLKSSRTVLATQESSVISYHRELKDEVNHKVTTTLPLFRMQYLNNPQPPYPISSRQAGEFGKVLLAVYVSEKGMPLEIKTKKSSGFERLDESARTTIAQWRFIPAKRGQENIAAWVNIPIEFNLPNADDE